MTETVTFEFAGMELRALVREGKPWFVVSDVCRCVGLTTNNTTQHTRNLGPDEVALNRIKSNSTGSGSGAKNALTISESGLYKIVMRCDKPKARQFQEWVTRDVLPAIRKDGMYVQGEEKVATGEMSEDELILKAVTLLQAKVERLSAENAVMKQELNFLTVDEYRALMHAYWTHSFKVKLGQMAAEVARTHGHKMDKQRRTLPSGRVINVGVYERRTLDEARMIIS
jgi:prophage antirepressor-like protein